VSDQTEKPHVHVQVMLDAKITHDDEEVTFEVAVTAAIPNDMPPALAQDAVDEIILSAAEVIQRRRAARSN